MRSYLEMSRFPIRNFRGINVPRLILGHLPFLGESYQGREKNHEYVMKFSNIQNTTKLLNTIVEKYGITVMAAPVSTEKLAIQFLGAIQEIMRRTDKEIAVIPCLQIPLLIDGEPLDVYRRWLTYYEIESKLTKANLLKKYLYDPILLCREGWKRRFKHSLANSYSYQEKEINELQINYQKIKQSITSLQGFKVLFIEPGSEIDFVTMTGRLDLLSELLDWLQDNFNYRVLLGSHHAGSTIPILEKAEIDFFGYITPVNKLGIMMFPTKRIALNAIKTAKKPIIAIKPLAGGRIPPSEAFEYIYKELSIYSCMIGVSSKNEADEDFPLALEILNKNP